jgi:2-C-methyl-D-erythritol 4-phosphate cytidylyltransferase
MRRRDLLMAFDRCPLPLSQITDDAQLLELTGEEVWLVAGDEANLKITTPADMLIARMFWMNQAAREVVHWPAGGLPAPK